MTIAALPTKRLVLRPLQLADAEQTQRLLSQWEERDYVSGKLASEIWQITADEWRAKRQALQNILQAEEQS